MNQIATTSSPTTDLAMTSEVRAAANAFAAALADTPEFRAFEERYSVFKHDRAAQDTTRLFQEKQHSLQTMQQLGMLEQAELDELNRLRDAMVNQPSVHAYMDAQNELMLICQAAAQELNASIEFDFTGACTAGCCG
jgi:cell fate (sporulation/competence/biofilm development) regulator YlbF (YheA/YmcA/DUF963 family)